MKSKLTQAVLCEEARKYAQKESKCDSRKLFGVTDGKAVGTYFEHKFQKYLQNRYAYQAGSSAKGIDFPQLKIDMKVTSFRQPQSSCPYKSARQKVYGLGYSLLIFVYEKQDDSRKRTGRLNILHTIFVEDGRTADYQTTTGLLKLVENNGNADDLVTFMAERFLPLDDIAAYKLAEEILQNKPKTGYLTISNALQWRLQYNRVISQAGHVDGIIRII